MPPMIIAAAVGIAASAAAAAAGYIMTALVITIAASAAGALLTKTKVPSLGNYTSQQERKQVLRSSSAPQVYVYGRTVVSGLLFFAEEEKGDQEKEWLHMAIAIAGHEIDAVEKVWLGDDLLGNGGYNGYVTWELHNNRTTVDPFMLANCTSWKSDMIGRGIAWVRLSLKFDKDKFPAGLPNVKFQIRGKKVYDPRNSKIAWSDNAALCILDYYRSVCGVPDAQIDMNQFIQAANISDQSAVAPNGSTYLRYRINGAFDLTDAQSSVLDDLHKACSGEPTYMAGRHGLLVGAYYGPATIDIQPGQIISDVKIVPEAAIAQKLNTVTGTFLDPQNQYTETEYPVVVVNEYVNEDGAEFADDFKLRFVANEYQAQQLAQIKMNRTRIGRTLTFTMNLSGYQYRPGFYVKLYLPQLGINGQEFRITDWDFAPNEGVKVTLKQETPAVWLDVIGKPIERPDITDFPVATVAAPINLTYTVTEIGQVVQGVFIWTNIGRDIAYNIVVIRQNGIAIQTVQVPGQRVNITGLKRGTYNLVVMAVNHMGQYSSEAMITIKIKAPSKPSGVDITQQFFAVTLRPRTTEIYTVSTQYDFWTSYEMRLPNASAATVEAQASRVGMGVQITSGQLLNNHTYWWYVRAINAFGASEFLEVEVLCYTDITELMPQIDKAISDSAAMKNVINGVDTNREGILQNALANKGTVERQFQQLGEVNAEILTVRTTIATVDGALAQLTTSVNSQFGTVNSQILEQQTTISNNKEAIASLNTYVQSQFGDVTAAINQKLDAEVTNNGTGKVSYTLNLGVVRNGVKYNTGFGMSLEPVGNSYRSTAVFAADQFGIYSGSDPGNYQAAFFVYNGQVFISDAFIQDGTIANAKIGNYIQSSTWDGSGNVGWHINKSGFATFNNVTIRGTVYATNGSFKGTVEATTFVGDIANVGIGSDAKISGGGVATRTITFTDSSSSALSKSALLESLIFVSSLSGTTTVSITLSINGNTRDLGTINVPAGTGGLWMTVRHAVSGITSATVTGTITVIGTRTASKAISSPTLTITRGTGSFA